MAGKPIVNIKSESPASATKTINVLAILPPGSFLHNQEYTFIAPDFLGWQLSIQGLDQTDELQ